MPAQRASVYLARNLPGHQRKRSASAVRANRRRRAARRAAGQAVRTRARAQRAGIGARWAVQTQRLAPDQRVTAEPAKAAGRLPLRPLIAAGFAAETLALPGAIGKRPGRTLQALHTARR